MNKIFLVLIISVFVFGAVFAVGYHINYYDHKNQTIISKEIDFSETKAYKTCVEEHLRNETDFSNPKLEEKNCLNEAKECIKLYGSDDYCVLARTSKCKANCNKTLLDLSPCFAKDKQCETTCGKSANNISCIKSCKDDGKECFSSLTALKDIYTVQCELKCY